MLHLKPVWQVPCSTPSPTLPSVNVHSKGDNNLKKYKLTNKEYIRVNINRSTGDINLSSYLEVVETLSEEEQAKQILLNEAKKINPDIKIGEFIVKELPPIELGRVAAQNAKGVIIQKVREADKSKQYNEYKDKI